MGSGHIAARLDRFLVQQSFSMLGFRSDSKILAFGASDHKPILLDLVEEKNIGPIPFRFSPIWINQDGFHDLVNSIWDSPVSGSPFFVSEEKLRRLKKSLKF